MNDVAASTDDDLVIMSPTYPSSSHVDNVWFRSQVRRHSWEDCGKWAQGDIGKGGTRGVQVRGTMLGVELRRAGGARLSSSQRSSLRLLACRLAGVGKDDGSCTFAPATRFETPTSTSIDGWLGSGVRVKSPGLHELQAECKLRRQVFTSCQCAPRPAPECVPMASQAEVVAHGVVVAPHTSRWRGVQS